MRISLNGESTQLPEGSDIHALLNKLNLRPQNVAVELNRKLIRSEKYGEPLKDGDAIEIVTFVGGG